MEFESIKKIVETEKAAENKKQEAKKQAQIILDHAEKSKEDSQEFFKKQVERRKIDFEKQKSEENRILIAKIEAEKNEKIQKLKEIVEGNISEAVDYIYNKIISI